MSKQVFCLMFAVSLVGGCGEEGAVVVEGGSVDLAFEDGDESNRYDEPIAATAVAVTAQDPETGATQLAVLALEPDGDLELTRWSLAIGLTREPAGGTTFAIPDEATILYQENPPGGGARWWEADAGSLEVASRDGDAATFAIRDASFVVSTSGSGNDAAGTFALSGAVSVDDLDDVIGF